MCKLCLVGLLGLLGLLDLLIVLNVKRCVCYLPLLESPDLPRLGNSAGMTNIKKAMKTAGIASPRYLQCIDQSV